MKDTVFIYFITGFLGSGKTTFLSNLLEMMPEEKIGLIINEFGQINIDSEVIKEKKGYPISEINNGQVFCGCVSGSFVESICEFIKLPIRHLIVETSGMANPYNIETILNAVEKKAEADYEYKGMICIVDATIAADLAEYVNAVRGQISKSEFLVVNKIDLADDNQLAKIDEMIANLNPEASVIKTFFGKINENDFLDFLSAKSFCFKNQTAKVESDFKRPLNYLLKAENTVDIENIISFSKEMMEYSYRIKGYIKAEKDVFRVEGVNKEIEAKIVDKDIEGVNLVLISSKGDIRKEIAYSWAKNVNMDYTISEEGKEFWN